MSEFSTELRPTERQFEKDGERIAELEKALEDACDVAIWLSGLECLRTNGEAWRTWEDSMRPKLFGALDARGVHNTGTERDK